MNVARKKLFVSVGFRFPMDRLLQSVDQFLTQHAGFSAIAQTGKTHRRFNNFEMHDFLSEELFRQHAQQADIHISHAGMGNILLAAELQKPIVIMPRKSSLAEHVNDHQIGTAQAFQNRGFIYVVNDFEELSAAIQAAQSFFGNCQLKRFHSPVVKVFQRVNRCRNQNP